ncbi:hypothetical protein O181_064114 [Austropuccinia psidii MF-1]|uniref:Uncharacterized protein n=1 Tax=Austropuccinia psidii MF-1 TaxID=1389203 RepID=A0A9Q3ENF6_9BASI|nr:hypothetical protein [Austropuccinia psidii MF-1]
MLSLWATTQCILLKFSFGMWHEGKSEAFEKSIEPPPDLLIATILQTRLHTSQTYWPTSWVSSQRAGLQGDEHSQSSSTFMEHCHPQLVIPNSLTGFPVDYSLNGPVLHDDQFRHQQAYTFASHHQPLPSFQGELPRTPGLNSQNPSSFEVGESSNHGGIGISEKNDYFYLLPQNLDNPWRDSIASFINRLQGVARSHYTFVSETELVWIASMPTLAASYTRADCLNHFQSILTRLSTWNLFLEEWKKIHPNPKVPYILITNLIERIWNLNAKIIYQLGSGVDHSASNAEQLNLMKWYLRCLNKSLSPRKIFQISTGKGKIYDWLSIQEVIIALIDARVKPNRWYTGSKSRSPTQYQAIHEIDVVETAGAINILGLYYKNENEEKWRAFFPTDRIFFRMLENIRTKVYTATRLFDNKGEIINHSAFPWKKKIQHSTMSLIDRLKLPHIQSDEDFLRTVVIKAPDVTGVSW